VPYLQCRLLTQAKRLHPEFQNQTRHSGYICHNQFESRNGLSGEILSTDLVMSSQSAACKVEIQWVGAVRESQNSDKLRERCPINERGTLIEIPGINKTYLIVSHSVIVLHSSSWVSLSLAWYRDSCSCKTCICRKFGVTECIYAP